MEEIENMLLYYFLTKQVGGAVTKLFCNNFFSDRRVVGGSRVEIVRSFKLSLRVIL